MSKGLSAALLPFLKADWTGHADLALTKEEIKAYQQSQAESQQDTPLPQNILKADRNRDGQVTLSEYLRWHPTTQAYAKPVVKYLNSKEGQALVRSLRENSFIASTLLQAAIPLVESAFHFVGAASKSAKQGMETYLASVEVKTANFTDGDASVCGSGSAYERLLDYGVKEEVAAQWIDYWHQASDVPDLSFLLKFLSVEELNTFLETCAWRNDPQGYLDVFSLQGMQALRELKAWADRENINPPFKNWIEDGQIEFSTLMDKAEALAPLYPEKATALYKILETKHLRETKLKPKDIDLLLQATEGFDTQDRLPIVKALASQVGSLRSRIEFDLEDLRLFAEAVKPYGSSKSVELIRGLCAVPNLFSKNNYPSLKDGEFARLLKSFHDHSISPESVVKVLTRALTSYPENFQSAITRLQVGLEGLNKLFPGIPEEHLPVVLGDAIVFAGHSAAMKEYFDTFERYFPSKDSRDRVVHEFTYPDLLNFIYFVGENRQGIEAIERESQPTDLKIQDALIKRAIYLREQHHVHRFSRYPISVVNDLMKKRNAGGKVFYLFSSYLDHNGAFYKVGEAIGVLHELGYEVPHLEINLDDQPARSLVETKLHQPQAGAIYAGHSDGKRIVFGGWGPEASFGPEDIDLFKNGGDRFKGFNAILWGCKTAYGEGSIAWQLAQAVPGIIAQGHRCNAGGYIDAKEKPHGKTAFLRTSCESNEGWEEARQFVVEAEDDSKKTYGILAQGILD